MDLEETGAPVALRTRPEPVLSIVAPCFQEAGNLSALHSAVARTLDGVVSDWELVLVDDGSTDDTLLVVRGLAATDPRVRWLSFSRNFGKEAAMLAGLRHARGDAVVIMDADLQHPPALLLPMVEAYREGYEQVVARRTRTGDPWRRTLMARCYYRAINRLVDVTLVDGGGDFRLLSRRAVDALLLLPEYNRFSKGLFAWIGFEERVVEYDNVGRGAGTSSWTFGKLVNYGVHGVLSFNDKPLRVAVYLGGATTLLSIAYVIWVVARTLLFGIDSPGYASLISAVVGLGGLQLVFLGIIGEYVGKVYYETKRRPAYVLRDSGGHGDPDT